MGTSFSPTAVMTSDASLVLPRSVRLAIGALLESVSESVECAGEPHDYHGPHCFPITDMWRVTQEFLGAMANAHTCEKTLCLFAPVTLSTDDEPASYKTEVPLWGLLRCPYVVNALRWQLNGAAELAELSVRVPAAHARALQWFGEAVTAVNEMFRKSTNDPCVEFPAFCSLVPSGCAADVYELATFLEFMLHLDIARVTAKLVTRLYNDNPADSFVLELLAEGCQSTMGTMFMAREIDAAVNEHLENCARLRSSTPQYNAAYSLSAIGSPCPSLEPRMEWYVAPHLGCKPVAYDNTLSDARDVPIKEHVFAMQQTATGNMCMYVTRYNVYVISRTFRVLFRRSMSHTNRVYWSPTADVQNAMCNSGKRNTRYELMYNDNVYVFDDEHMSLCGARQTGMGSRPNQRANSWINYEFIIDELATHDDSSVTAAVSRWGDENQYSAVPTPSNLTPQHPVRVNVTFFPPHVPHTKYAIMADVNHQDVELVRRVKTVYWSCIRGCMCRPFGINRRPMEYNLMSAGVYAYDPTTISSPANDEYYQISFPPNLTLMRDARMDHAPMEQVVSLPQGPCQYRDADCTFTCKLYWPCLHTTLVPNVLAGRVCSNDAYLALVEPRHNEMLTETQRDLRKLAVGTLKSIQHRTAAYVRTAGRIGTRFATATLDEIRTVGLVPELARSMSFGMLCWASKVPAHVAIMYDLIRGPPRMMYALQTEVYCVYQSGYMRPVARSKWAASYPLSLTDLSENGSAWALTLPNKGSVIAELYTPGATCSDGWQRMALFTQDCATYVSLMNRGFFTYNHRVEYVSGKICCAPLPKEFQATRIFINSLYTDVDVGYPVCPRDRAVTTEPINGALTDTGVSALVMSIGPHYGPQHPDWRLVHVTRLTTETVVGLYMHLTDRLSVMMAPLMSYQVWDLTHNRPLLHVLPVSRNFNKFNYVVHQLYERPSGGDDEDEDDGIAAADDDGDDTVLEEAIKTYTTLYHQLLGSGRHEFVTNDSWPYITTYNGRLFAVSKRSCFIL